MDKLYSAIGEIEPVNDILLKRAQERLDNLTKPRGSLGRLEELAKLIVAISGKEDPHLNKKTIFTLAADHGVTEEGISAFPKEVTAQMVYNFINGGAGINVLARHANVKVVIVDIGVASDIKPSPGLIIKKVGYGTGNMVKGPAMSRDEAIKAVEFGIEIFNDELVRGIDIIGTGEMGIGNTTASSAITAVLTDKGVGEVTGRGTGINDKVLENKVRTIEAAIKHNRPIAKDAIDVLSKVGGFEIGGLAGIILAAASKKVPVVIDGFISGAAALLAYSLSRKTKDYMIAGHCSVEKGHRIILDHIGLKPILDLDLRLGEGTGAALAIGVVESAVKILTQMASFKKASVSERIAE